MSIPSLANIAVCPHRLNFITLALMTFVKLCRLGQALIVKFVLAVEMQICLSCTTHPADPRFRRHVIDNFLTEGNSNGVFLQDILGAYLVAHLQFEVFGRFEEYITNRTELSRVGLLFFRRLFRLESFLDTHINSVFPA